jgi:hypothetical protein
VQHQARRIITGVPRIAFGPVSLEVEPGWALSTLILAGPTMDEPEDEESVAFAEPKRFRLNLVATMETVDEAVTPGVYVGRQIEGLRKAQVKRQESAPPETVKLADGREGLLTEQVILGPDDAAVRQLQLVTIKDRIAYTLIASALDGPSYDRVRDGFRHMLLSFV